MKVNIETSVFSMNIKILQNELVQKNEIIRSLLEIIRQCSILYQQQEINQLSQI